MSQPIYPLYQPQVLQETCEGICRFDVRDQMLANRELELCGPIDAESAAILIRNLLLPAARRNAVAPIKMFINSPGGEGSIRPCALDVMQTLSCPVTTICLGMAASMAALVFVSGARREMLPHSRVMIHDPLIGGGLGGSALSVKARADDLMRIRDITGEVLARHTGMTLERVFELTAQDTYFEAEAAVEAGLADAVVASL